MSGAVNWIGSFDDFLVADSYFLTHFPGANSLPKFIKMGISRSCFVAIDFLFAAAFLLRFLAKSGDFQGRKSGP